MSLLEGPLPEAHKDDALMAMANQVLDDLVRSGRVLNEDGVEGLIGNGAVKDDHRGPAEERAGEPGLTISRRNYDQAIDVVLQHMFGFVEFCISVFIGRCDEDRVAVATGDGGDGVGAGGEEGIVEVGDDDADRPALLAAKCAG
jgi:hypothetical protein